jgi:hypothetical protein
MTLINIWEQSEKKPGLKVRYIDWDYRVKFFEIQSFDKAKLLFEGILCTGEKVTYEANSKFWALFESDEQSSVLVA